MLESEGANSFRAAQRKEAKWLKTVIIKPGVAIQKSLNWRRRVQIGILIDELIRQRVHFEPEKKKV